MKPLLLQVELTHEPLSAVALCEEPSRDVAEGVAVEEAAEDEALRLGVPLELAPVLFGEGKTERLERPKQTWRRVSSLWRWDVGCVVAAGRTRALTVYEVRRSCVFNRVCNGN